MDTIITGIFGVLIAMLGLVANRNQRKSILDEQAILANLKPGSADYLDLSESLSHRVRRLASKNGTHLDWRNIALYFFGFGYGSLLLSTLLYGSFAEAVKSMEGDRSLELVLNVCNWLGVSVGAVSYIWYRVEDSKLYARNTKRRHAMHE